MSDSEYIKACDDAIRAYKLVQACCLPLTFVTLAVTVTGCGLCIVAGLTATLIPVAALQIRAMRLDRKACQLRPW